MRHRNIGGSEEAAGSNPAQVEALPLIQARADARFQQTRTAWDEDTQKKMDGGDVTQSPDVSPPPPRYYRAPGSSLAPWRSLPQLLVLPGANRSERAAALPP